MFHTSRLTKTTLALFLSLAASSALAAVTPQQAEQLKTTLTPMGAERAGNAAGTIPTWNGGITQAPVGYKPGQHHLDPYAADKPLFTITKVNLEQYKAHLSPGQIALFNSYPDTFQMPVYPSRRSGSAPQWLYDNTLKNATSAKLIDGGTGFADAYGGVPFPVPKDGIEVLSNHITRYRGIYVVRRASEAPVQRNGSFALVTSQQEGLFNYYRPGGQFADLKNILFYYLAFVKSPARLAGGAALFTRPWTSSRTRVRPGSTTRANAVCAGRRTSRMTRRSPHPTACARRTIRTCSTARQTATTGSSRASKRSTFPITITKSAALR